MIDSVWPVNVSNPEPQLTRDTTTINLDRSRSGGLRMAWLLLTLLVAKARNASNRTGGPGDWTLSLTVRYIHLALEQHQYWCSRPVLEKTTLDTTVAIGTATSTILTVSLLFDRAYKFVHVRDIGRGSGSQESLA